MDEVFTDQLQPPSFYSPTVPFVASWINYSIVWSILVKLLDMVESMEPLLIYAWLTSFQIISPVVSIILEITGLNF